MSFFKPSPLILGVVLFFLLVKPVRAFGAGNIASMSKVEGENWRHGDIEDALLQIAMARVAGGRKFDKLNISRVYFGNWLRDYSQAIDVGTVKSVSAEAIRLLLSVLGFLTFGYGSREFEVTADRLGCYRPEDHIDNPKNYADNEDARQYDRRLRGPVDERSELGIDGETGMKNYIANERARIMTSAQHVKTLFGRCIQLGRSYERSRDKRELHEALRLLGTGLHCLEDYLAHSNYTELALIEMGERDVFPHVGRGCLMRLRGARNEVYPVVTGTFGGVDFLHSVTGEVSDKLTQNEIQELEGQLANNQKNDTSYIKDLLDKIPDGIFGGDDKKHKMDEIQSNATAAQMQQTQISPRDPEEQTLYVKGIFEQMMPVIEFHDELLQNISEAMEKIPILPKIIEQLEEELSKWVFAIIAPFILPIIGQIKNELATGSSEIIESSRREQHIVFEDDRCSDPTHSMLSKDHFTNILNEVAGKTASKVVSWVVPQLMEAWDDGRADVDRTLNRIVNGILHHPAQRDGGEDGAREGRALMFQSVEEWWRNMDERQRDEYRRKLSREGVQRGENHKEGVHDSGHGCGKPLGMHKNFGSGGNTLEDKIAGAAAGAIVGGITGGISGIVEGQTGYKLPEYKQQQSSSGFGSGGGESEGGLGGLLNAAGSLLGGNFKGEETETHSSSGRRHDGGYQETVTQYGRTEDNTRYGQAEYSRTEYPSGGERQEYNRYEQDNSGRHGSRYEETSESRPSHGGRYEERTETRYEESSGGYGGGRRNDYEESSGGYGGSRRNDFEEESSGYGRRQEQSSYGGGYEGRQEESGGYGGDYGGRQEGSGGYGGGRRRDDEDESSGYGRRQDDRRDDEGDGMGGLLGGIAKAAEDAFGGDDRERRGGWGS